MNAQTNAVKKAKKRYKLSTKREISRALVRIGMRTGFAYVDELALYGNPKDITPKQKQILKDAKTVSRALIDSEPALRTALSAREKDRLADSLAIKILGESDPNALLQASKKAKAGKAASAAAKNTFGRELDRAVRNLINSHSTSSYRSLKRMTVAAAGGFIKHAITNAPSGVDPAAGVTGALFGVTKSGAKDLEQAAANQAGGFVETHLYQEDRPLLATTAARATRGFITGFGIGGFQDPIEKEIIANGWNLRGNVKGRTKELLGMGWGEFSKGQGLRKATRSGVYGAIANVAEQKFGAPEGSTDVSLFAMRTLKNPIAVGKVEEYLGRGALKIGAERLGLQFIRGAVVRGATTEAAAAASAGVSTSAVAGASTTTIAGVSLGTIATGAVIVGAAALAIWGLYELFGKDLLDFNEDERAAQKAAEKKRQAEYAKRYVKRGVRAKRNVRSGVRAVNNRMKLQERLRRDPYSMDASAIVGRV